MLTERCMSVLGSRKHDGKRIIRTAPNHEVLFADLKRWNPVNHRIIKISFNAKRFTKDKLTLNEN